MKNRYFKNDTVYVGGNDGIQITVFTKAQEFSINSEILNAQWHLNNGYEEITRTEFMEAYLPISEKMNNKIGEL